MIFSRDDGDQRRATLSLGGEIDLATAPSLHHVALNLPLRELERLTVDLADVTFMDSTGVGFLVSLRKHMSAGSELVVINTAPMVTRVLQITGLGDLLDLPQPSISPQRSAADVEQSLDATG